MANTYFNYTNPVKPGSPILSSKYNGDFSAVERAFDTLPAPNELVTSYKNFGTTSGSGSAYALNLEAFDPSFGYPLGMQVVVKVHVDNTGPATISVNGLPAVTIINLVTGLGPLVARDMRVGAVYSLRYDGANFQLVNASSNAVADTATCAAEAKAAAATAKAAADNVAPLYANLFAGPLAVNAVKFYDPAVNPNTLYPGTTWVQLSGTSSSAKAWRRTA